MHHPGYYAFTLESPAKIRLDYERNHRIKNSDYSSGGVIRGERAFQKDFLPSLITL